MVCVPFFAEIFGAMVIVFLLAVLYEGLKTLRDLLLLENIVRFKALKLTRKSSQSTESTPLNPTDPPKDRQVILSVCVINLHYVGVLNLCFIVY